jgi:hypothetical protein
MNYTPIISSFENEKSIFYIANLIYKLIKNTTKQ